MLPYFHGKIKVFRCHSNRCNVSADIDDRQCWPVHMSRDSAEIVRR